MIVVQGWASSLLVTLGYGRKYLNPFVKIRDFEKSFYKFLKEGYADLNGYPVYYGNLRVNTEADDIWLYCNFSELNVETGDFSYAFIDVVTRVQSVDEYNTQLSVVIDELRSLFANSNIDLYDFTYSEFPQRVTDSKIVVQDIGRPIYERIEALEFEGLVSLLQASQMTVKLKLLENFSRSRVV